MSVPLDGPFLSRAKHVLGRGPNTLRLRLSHTSRQYYTATAGIRSDLFLSRAKGHCLAEIGVVAETQEIYQQSLMSVGDSYQEAAAICPQDDEMRQGRQPVFLYVLQDSLLAFTVVYAWRLLLCHSCFGTGVMGIFQLMGRHINEIIPATMPIWQNSDRIKQFQQGMDVMTERIMTSTGSGFVNQSNTNDLLETTLPYKF